jgi:hypothetical protein
MTTDKEKLDKYNKQLEVMAEEVKAKDPEFSKGLLDLRAETLDEIFQPYKDWVKELEESKKTDPLYSVPEEKIPDGVFVSRGNEETSFERFLGKYLGMSTFYGVCDNGSQVRTYYDFLVSEGFIDPDQNYVIFIVPILKRNQPEYGGWRWHKWGEYIGEQEHGCEYIYNEPNVDLVYTFGLYPYYDTREEARYQQDHWWDGRLELMQKLWKLNAADEDKENDGTN